MIKPEDVNCVTTGKGRDDRQAQTKNRFEPLQLDVKCPDTAILLLGSRERPVLVAAAAALTKFAAKGKENLQKLFELDIVENLPPLLDHEDLFTRRFAARLLAEMMAIQFVRNHFLESEYHVPRFAKILMQDSDIFMREYASLLIAELSKDPYGAVKILEHFPNLDFLFENLKIADPDVKKNIIEIVNNLLKDSTGADRIIESQAFSFVLICRLLEESFPEIQALALSTLDSLVARNRNEHIQRLFRESGALKIMSDLLDNVDFTDSRSNILRVLVRSAQNLQTAESLVTGGGVSKFFSYFENCTNPKESRDILDLLVHLAGASAGRKILHNFGLIEHLKNSISSRDPEMMRIACSGIGSMSRYEPASKEIAQENFTKLILDVLKDESLKWTVRESAAFALKELCTSDRRNCLNLIEIKGPTYVEGLLKQGVEKVPLEILLMSIDILTFIGEYPDSRKIVVQVELIGSLCAAFEAKDRAVDELKIAACRALGNFCVEKSGREIFFAGNFVKKLLDLLLDVESTPVRAAAVQLVQQLSSDSAIVDQFLQAGYLNYMLKNRSISNVVPIWNTCIDALYSAHLPVKFAAKGRISLHENTLDGFYVMRRQICPFPILDELFRLKMCPMEPIYVVNFADPRSSINDDRTRLSSVTKGHTHTCMNSAGAWLELNFGKLRKDQYLHEYLELFRCILAANEPDDSADETIRGIADLRKIASRAELLGKFVARQLSGPDPRNPCIDHQLEIHVREIRADIETSVIPLGQLRVGSYLERALLFKVMADRIFLPATLVRGEYGKAWNEIAIPQIDNSVEDFDSSRLVNILESTNESSGRLFARNRETTKIIRDERKIVLPTNLLRENYIVDLMEKPGDLMPIGSSRARNYCAPILHCLLTCNV